MKEGQGRDKSMENLRSVCQPRSLISNDNIDIFFWICAHFEFELRDNLIKKPNKLG